MKEIRNQTITKDDYENNTYFKSCLIDYYYWEGNKFYTFENCTFRKGMRSSLPKSLSGCQFKNCKFEGDFSNFRFEQCKFDECNFIGANLKNVDLRDCSGETIKFENSLFSQVSFRECNFGYLVMINCRYVNYPSDNSLYFSKNIISSFQVHSDNPSNNRKIYIEEKDPNQILKEFGFKIKLLPDVQES